MNRAGSKDIVILAAKRTPFGTFGGTLKDLTATDLAVHASKAALAQAGVPADDYGHVVFGNVAQTSADAAYLARHVGLRAGLPERTPALVVNRLCGSGFEALVYGAMLLETGQAELVLAGGTESMSQAPLALRGTRWGFPLGKPPPLEDTLWSALTDSYAGLPMALTAEKLAEQYRITQDEVDEYSAGSQRRWAAADEAGRFAAELAPVEVKGKKGPVQFAKDEHPRPDTTVESLKKLAEQYRITQDEVDEYSAGSQRRWAAADEAGRFADELAPVEVKGKKGPVQFAKDEHPRPDTTVEGLKKLPKVFKKDGVVHAGAASGICDGAGALVLATREYAEKRGVKPLARLVNWGHAGVDPTVMGIGPAPAVRNALARAGAKLGDFDLFEVNEAFAPQVLAVLKELDLPRDRTNVDGGAIALGHPLAASGARIAMHLVYELRRRRARTAIGSACIGGGQGIAVLLEALP